MEPYTDTNSGLHYDLRLQVDPQAGYLSVAGSLAYHSPQPGLERARFYLHNQFNIQRVEGKRVLGYHFEHTGEPQAPSLPQASVLDIYFNPPLGLNETTLIQFSYHGELTDWPAESVNLVTPDWVELGMHLPWYPLQFDGSPSDLTFTLKVTCPPGYQVGGLGTYLENGGEWYFTRTLPTSDIVVAVGRNLETQVFESETNRFILNTSTFGPDAAETLGNDMLWTQERFSGWFGPVRPAEFTLIESPRTLGGGYARQGLIVLGGVNEHEYLDQREAYLRYLAHEAAHAWWWEASDQFWEDWLNESFAEFSALLAIRERFGVESYERFLLRKRDRIPVDIPLWGFDRASASTPDEQAVVERMLYDKGPLLLHNLCERIGYQRFLELCRARLWSGVTSTSHFLDLLEELEDPPTRVWMENQLKAG